MKPPRLRSKFASVLLTLGWSALSPSAVTAQELPAPDPADVRSIDAIITATYDVISGPADEPRDWDRFRSLFAPGARLIPTDNGPQMTTADEYAEAADQFFRQTSFFERELGRVVEQYGWIAHAFSSYESRTDPDGPVIDSGVNSFQLYFDGRRWWIVTILWDRASRAGPIPERYRRNRAQ
ncbi:MAG: nuclear transport factor 2 family protein [Gemmatimonadales bacterium]